MDIHNKKSPQTTVPSPPLASPTKQATPSPDATDTIKNTPKIHSTADTTSLDSAKMLPLPHSRSRTPEPSLKETKALAKALHILEHAPELEKLEIDKPLKPKSSAAYIALAQGLTAANMTDLAKIELSLETLNAHGKLSSNEKIEFRTLLYQRAFDACVRIASQASRMGNPSLVSLSLEKANRCSYNVLNIKFTDPEVISSIWKESRANECKYYILSSLDAMLTDSSHAVKDWCKKASAAHKDIIDGSVRIEYIDPIYHASIIQDPKMLESLYSRLASTEQMRTFSRRALTFSGRKEIQKITQNSINSMDVIRNVIDQISQKSTSSDKKSDALQSQEVHHSTAQITNNILHLLEDSEVMKLSIDSNQEKITDVQIEHCIHENTAHNVVYSETSTKRHIQIILEESLQKFENARAEEKADKDIIRLSKKDQKQLKDAIASLLISGFDESSTFEIICKLITIDIEKHNISKYNNISLNPPQELLQAIHIAFLSRSNGPTEHLINLSKDRFTLPYKDTKYAVPSDLSLKNNKTSDAEHIKKFYCSVYDYQESLFLQAFKDIEEIPYAIQIDAKGKHSKPIRLRYLEILQGRVQQLFIERKSREESPGIEKIAIRNGLKRWKEQSRILRD